MGLLLTLENNSTQPASIEVKPALAYGSASRPEGRSYASTPS